MNTLIMANLPMAMVLLTPTPMAMVILTPTPMAMVIFDRLTYDVALYLFQSFSGKLRSGTCSVSKLWYKIALTASRSLSKVPHMYDRKSLSQNEHPAESLWNYNLEHKYGIMRDYHLVVRLKCRSSLQLNMACYGGCIDVVALVLDKVKIRTMSEYNEGLYNIMYTGNTKIIDLMISRGAIIDEGLKGACMCNNIPAIDYIISHGASDYDNGAVAAAMSGAVEALNIMLELNPRSATRAFTNACGENQREVVDILLAGYDISKTTMEKAFMRACHYGHYTLARYVLSCIPDTEQNQYRESSGIIVTNAIYKTIQSGELDLADVMIEIGSQYDNRSNNHNSYLSSMCCNIKTTVSIVKYVIDKGAEVSLHNLESAAVHNNTIFMYMMSLVPIDMFIKGFYKFMTVSYKPKKLDAIINVTFPDVGDNINNNNISRKEARSMIKGVITIIKLHNGEFIESMQPQINQMLDMLR